MKKLLISLVVVVLVLAGCLTIFAACSGGNSDHTIYFYSTMGDNLQTVADQAIEAFETKYPGWTVEHTQPGDYPDVRDKIKSEYQAGNQPDLAYCYPDHVAMYITYGGVVDMSKFMTSTEKVTYTYVDEDGVEQTVTAADQLGFTEEEIAAFVPGYYAEGKATNFSDYEKYGYTADSIITMPFVKSSELMYVNMTALKAVGYTKAPDTWDELWAMCAKIKAKYPTSTPLGYDSEANWFITMCEQNGWGYTSPTGEHYLFNNSDTQEWLQKLQGYYDKGYITTRQDYNGAYTSNLFVKGPADGGAVFCIGSSAGASHQDPNGLFDLQICRIPGSKVGNDVNYSCISQGPSLVMLTGAKGVSNPEEKQKMTWLFLKELLAPEFQAAFSMETGYNPMRTDVAEKVPVYKSHLDGTDATAIAASITSGLSDWFFTSPAFYGSSDARDQVGNALLLAITGTDPARALRDAVANCPKN